MNGSESFGAGERFYHGVCPVTLSTECTLTCPRCKMISYKSEEARLTHEETHSSLCRLIARLSQAAGGRNPLDRWAQIFLFFSNIFLTYQDPRGRHPAGKHRQDDPEELSPTLLDDPTNSFPFTSSD